MFLSKKTYEDLRLEWIKCREEAAILDRVNRQQQTTLDWLMLRVTQLEKERAALLFKMSGVVIETPVISREPVSPIPQNVPVDALPIFDDMGNDAAKKLGIGWKPDGTIDYAL